MSPLFRRRPERTVAAPTYRLLDERAPVDRLDMWPRLHVDFTHVVGYSYLGHAFLLDERTGRHAVLHPFLARSKAYGPFSSTTDFVSNILDDSGFANYVLRPAHQDAIRARLGIPEPDTIYIPTPYPMLGGNEAPETYELGDVWVFWSIVGQLFLED